MVSILILCATMPFARVHFSFFEKSVRLQRNLLLTLRQRPGKANILGRTAPIPRIRAMSAKAQEKSKFEMYVNNGQVNLSAGKKNTRPVVINGTFYVSVTEASLQLRLPYKSLHRSIINGTTAHSRFATKKETEEALALLGDKDWVLLPSAEKEQQPKEPLQKTTMIVGKIEEAPPAPPKTEEIAKNIDSTDFGEWIASTKDLRSQLEGRRSVLAAELEGIEAALKLMPSL